MRIQILSTALCAIAPNPGPVRTLLPNRPAGKPVRLMETAGDFAEGIAIAREGYLSPFYSYGAMLAALPCWSVGTALGTIAGELLPLRLVSAFSVALYGMFLAVIIPPAKKNKVVGILVATVVPGISNLSGGTRTILLTVILSAGAAILFPRTAQEEEDRHDA